MKNSLKNLSHKTKITVYLRAVMPYSFVIFVVIVAGIYGFIMFRVNTLSNQQPSADAVSGQVQAAQALRVDPKVVEQLKSLQDNSVSVQALFDEARANPFEQ